MRLDTPTGGDLRLVGWSRAEPEDVAAWEREQEVKTVGLDVGIQGYRADLLIFDDLCERSGVARVALDAVEGLRAYGDIVDTNIDFNPSVAVGPFTFTHKVRSHSYGDDLVGTVPASVTMFGEIASSIRKALDDPQSWQVFCLLGGNGHVRIMERDVRDAPETIFTSEKQVGYIDTNDTITLIGFAWRDIGLKFNPEIEHLLAQLPVTR